MQAQTSAGARPQRQHQHYFAFYWCVRPQTLPGVLTRFVVALWLTLTLATAGAADSAPDPESTRQSVVQILAYRGDTLLNQGSGVVAGEPGLVVTDGHLLLKADRIVVKDAAGQEFPATVLTTDTHNDIAALRSAVAAKPVPLSQRAPVQHDTLEIIGYWTPALETSRASFFGLSDRPGFVATVQTASRRTKALLNEKPSADFMLLAASMGRGGYGAPLFNRCAQLAGLVRPAREKSAADLWKPHLPVGATAVTRDTLAQLFSTLGITFTVAEKSCLSVAEELEEEKQRARREAAEATRKKKQQLKKAEEKAARERQAREQAEEERDKAVDELDAAKDDTSEVVAEITDRVRALDQHNSAAEEKNRYLIYAIAGGGLLTLLVVFLLVRKRRKDLRAAGQALAAASARFADCRFEGNDSSGAPVAFFVSGQDLMQRPTGLLVGRNPDRVSVVIADDTVSREHARLFVENNRLHIEDLNSTGGTKVNGVPVSAAATIVISGDRVEFGQVALTLTLMAAAN